MNPLPKSFAAAALAVALLPAGAATFDFANLKYNVNNNGINTGFLPTDGIACTGGDLCSSSVNNGLLNGDLTFTSGGITVAATGMYNNGVAAVVQDHETGYSAQNKIGAGLGVYHQSGNNSDDNITLGETLIMTFSQLVHLTGISLRSEGHDVSGWAANSTFLFNGANRLLPIGSGNIALDLTGTQFTFAYGGRSADQFYLSGLTATAVPEPGTVALMLAGLAGIGLVIRRRRSAS